MPDFFTIVHNGRPLPGYLFWEYYGIILSCIAIVKNTSSGTSAKRAKRQWRLARPETDLKLCFKWVEARLRAISGGN